MKMLTEQELAARWGITRNALQKWRSDGKGPTFLKLERAVRYRIEDVVEYENINQINPQGVSVNEDRKSVRRKL